MVFCRYFDSVYSVYVLCDVVIYVYCDGVSGVVTGYNRAVSLWCFRCSVWCGWLAFGCDQCFSYIYIRLILFNCACLYLICFYLLAFSLVISVFLCFTRSYLILFVSLCFALFGLVLFGLVLFGLVYFFLVLFGLTYICLILFNYACLQLLIFDYLVISLIFFNYPCFSCFACHYLILFYLVLFGFVWFSRGKKSTFVCERDHNSGINNTCISKTIQKYHKTAANKYHKTDPNITILQCLFRGIVYIFPYYSISLYMHICSTHKLCQKSYFTTKNHFDNHFDKPLIFLLFHHFLITPKSQKLTSKTP